MQGYPGDRQDKENCCQPLSDSNILNQGHAWSDVEVHMERRDALSVKGLLFCSIVCSCETECLRPIFRSACVHKREVIDTVPLPTRNRA